MAVPVLLLGIHEDTIDTEKHPNMAAAITIDAIDIVLLDFDIVLLLLRRPAIELISNNCTAASQSPAKQYRF